MKLQNYILNKIVVSDAVKLYSWLLSYIHMSRSC